MRGTTRGAVRLGILVVIVVATGVSPVHASHTTLLSAEVFGDIDVRVDPVKGKVLHAWGAPYGRDVTPSGLAWVRGRAGTGGSFIDIVADDDDPLTPAVRKTVTAEPATLHDGAPNPDSGSFFTSINVTDLGTHVAAGDPAAGDGGASVLRFTVTSRLASGAVSNAIQDSLTKYAGSRYDSFQPKFMTRRGEPGSDTGYTVVGGGLWCHKLPKRPFFGNFGFNALSTSPDAAARQVKELNNMENEDPRDTRRWDSYWSGCSDESTVPVRGFSANVTDDGDPAVTFGIASEIGDVTVTISGGPLTEPRVVRPQILRGGTGASISMLFRIEEFEPTYYVSGPATVGPVPVWLAGGPDEISAGPYTIDVRFRDAWGNHFDWMPMSFDVCKC